MRAATLTPIALGLIVVFRANIWNLGYQGQFLLSAAMVAGLGPHLERHLSATLTLIVLFLVAGVTGAVWTLIPAILKAWYQTNEIITTLMMTFIGISLAASWSRGRSRTSRPTCRRRRCCRSTTCCPRSRARARTSAS